MKKIFQYLMSFIVMLILKLRYRIRIEGADKLTPEALNKAGGTLFLPDHPTFFVDPIMAILAIWPRFPVRPLAVEFMYYAPFISTFMRFMNALPVPNFETSSNGLKRKKAEKAVQEIVDGLKKGESFLVYPSGKAKHTGYESIGGASATHHLIQEVPEVNVVLMRIKGLWGSSFSYAVTDKSPPFLTIIKDSFKIILKNLIFFTPRREVIIELEVAPADFPFKGSRIELNQYLEKWYNRPDGLSKQKGEYPGDSLVLVSYSMWGEKYLPVKNFNSNSDKEISLEGIPSDVQEKIIKKIAELKSCDPKTIKPEMSLATDLGLDSLDAAELSVFVEDNFSVSQIPASELTTVVKLMAIASKKIVLPEEEEETKKESPEWKQNIEKKRVDIAPGNTIAEVFLNQCQLSKNKAACADERSGVLTYSQLKMRALLLAEYIRKLPGTYIGIMLPASVGSNILIMACEIAGKVPLMVNWTVGPRHLESVVSQSGVKTILSSWGFIDKLENVEFDKVSDLIVMLEDVVREISLTDKIKAFIRSKRSTQGIMRIFGIDKQTKDDQAVLLFTSGTESMPKGVPLTNGNLLSNFKAATKAVELFSDDILFGILPPFHSFGFTISGLLGLLAGFRVFYSPNPTEGKRLARLFATWKPTIMCGAPTFIRGILKAASTEGLHSMRLCVTGAEKAPAELFQMLDHLGKPNTVMEGYGITECSPILTMNPPGSAHKGVGKPLPGIELCIINPETNEVQPTGSRGLILAKGPNIFSGYLNPSISSPFITIQGESWYKTGDLGFLDEDNYLTISGRMKRFVKVGGEMISLSSIEEALNNAAHSKGWPLNKEGPSLAVCAKELPGEKSLIYLFTSFDVQLEDVNSTLKEGGFSNLARITEIIKMDELPMTGTGKTNYRLLETEHLPNKES